jgi:hypothetical protein
MRVTLDELRRLAFGVEPIAFHEAPPGSEPRVVAFNGVVSRFRELVVAARNQVVLGRPIPPHMGLEIRALSEALPEERRRALPAPATPPGRKPGPTTTDR